MTVLVSQYGACSDTCLPWQGRVYIDDVFQAYYGPRSGSFGVSRNGRQYMLLSIAIQGGLFHPNCRHTISTWIEDISTMPVSMNIAEIERVNRLEAQQRRLEREVRQAKREAEGLSDPRAIQSAERRLRVRQSALRKFVDENSDVLRRDYWRERDTGVPESKGTELDLDLAFYPNSKYRANSGEFDIEKAKADYSNFLTSVPEKNKIFLKQAITSVGYQETALKNAAFGYSAINDTIFYDTSKADFWNMDFRVVNTHELAHRIERMFVNSQGTALFRDAVKNAKTIFLRQPDVFIRYCYEQDDLGFVSDIFSAISEDEYDLPTGHSTEYWKRQGAKEREIFANLFSLEAFGDNKKIDFFREHFPDLYEAYNSLEFEVS